MLEYRCDWCGRQKKPDETWILGLALERKGVSGSRRQFETLRSWNGKWASHPLAVHLCCEQHKKKYLDALFASPWPAVSRGEIARAAHLRRTEDHNRKNKDDGAAAAEWYIEVGPAEPAKREKTSTQKKKSHSKSCKAEPPAIEFSETDHFHARALGIVLDATETPKPTKSPEPPESKNLGADDADKSSR